MVPLGRLLRRPITRKGLSVQFGRRHYPCSLAKVFAPFSSSANPAQNPGYFIFFILGGPGSGKGTQCERLEEQFEFNHLSIGELLRKELKRYHESQNRILDEREHGEQIGRKERDEARTQHEVESANSGEGHGFLIGKAISEGTMLPGYVPVSLLKKEMADIVAKNGKQNPTRPTLFFIDGFPRTLENMNEFERQVVFCIVVLENMVLLGLFQNCVSISCAASSPRPGWDRSPI